MGYRTLEKVQISGNIADVDAMVVLSQGKGHGQCGFGGAIKNIAMGCVTQTTRGWLHALMDTQFKWDEEACEHCNICVENCPAGAISFDDKGKLNIFSHHCRYCMHCVDSCPAKAIEIATDSIRYFQEGMARATKTGLDTCEQNRVLYLTLLMNITPLCDCWGFSSPSLVPDVGIIAGNDCAAIDTASLDMIRAEDFIPNGLPTGKTLIEGDGHLFERIHGKDPYLMVRYLTKYMECTTDYEVEEVR